MNKNLIGSDVHEDDLVAFLREQGAVVEKIIGPGDIPNRNSYRPYVNPWTTSLPWVGQEAVRDVDEYFADKPECPLVLPTGQAVVFKMP